MSLAETEQKAWMPRFLKDRDLPLVSLDQLQRFAKLPWRYQHTAKEAYEHDALPIQEMANEKFIDRLSHKLKLAIHETAHAQVLLSSGFQVIERSLHGVGDTLAFVRFIPKAFGSIKDTFYGLLKAAEASEIGESLFGIQDHGGCAGDRGQSRFYSGWLEVLTGNSRMSISSQARSDVFSQLSGQMHSTYNEAWVLVKAGSLSR